MIVSCNLHLHVSRAELTILRFTFTQLSNVVRKEMANHENTARKRVIDAVNHVRHADVVGTVDKKVGGEDFL